MTNSIIQPSFAGGEISPSLYGRVDMEKYQTALRHCNNFIVRQFGGLDNRPGMQFIAKTKDSTKKSRLIPFQFSTVQTYALEFGNKYMRVFMNGGEVLYSSGPNQGQVFEMVTPYAEEDLFDLHFTQSADVMTIVHNNYPPQELRRHNHDDWDIVEFETNNGPFENQNIDKTKTVYASATTGTVTLTSTDAIFGDEQLGKLFYLEQPSVDSVPVWETSKSTSISDERRADYNYYKADTAGTTGTVRPYWTEGKAWDGWGGTTGVQWEYLHSGFGIVKITAVGADHKTATGTVISTLPSNVVGSANASYKWARYAWNSVNGYPGTVAYFQQRLIFASSLNEPQSIWMSRIGDYSDFGKSNPQQDDDSISFTLAARQVNKIRHLVALNSLICLTSGGEWAVKGGQDDIITPSTINLQPQAYNGASNVTPVTVNNIALFVQDKGSVVRDLSYSFDVDGYQGSDLTILANHLFKKYKIIDWGFAIIPYSCAFCVRDDGVLLCLTYLRDQQVIAWSPQYTDGFVESVCTISEGNEDAIYFIVRRVINGTAKRYVERLASRNYDVIDDAFFVDSGLSYDGRNNSDTTVTITGGSGDWDYRNDLTLVLSVANNDVLVGDVIQLPYAEDNENKELRLTVITVINNTHFIVQSNRNVPEIFRDTPTTDWKLAKQHFLGLDHLEGKTVNILSDGNVEPQQVVTSGAVTLSRAGAVVHIGLPITGNFETLDINVGNQETLLDKKKLITSASLIIDSSRGIFAGTDEDNLYEYPQREFEFYDDPVNSTTGVVEVKLDSNWSKNGRVVIKHTDPLPLSVLGIIPRVTVGGF